MRTARCAPDGAPWYFVAMLTDRSVGIPALSVAALLLATGCGDADVPVPSAPHGGGTGIEGRIEALLAQMTLEEKVDQMHGRAITPTGDLWPTPDNSRLGIPGFQMVDGPRGVRAGTYPSPRPS